jgi:hypothetical protein
MAPISWSMKASPQDCSSPARQKNRLLPWAAAIEFRQIRVQMRSGLSTADIYLDLRLYPVGIVQGHRVESGVVETFADAVDIGATAWTMVSVDRCPAIRC